MKRRANVYLRTKDTYKEVYITGDDKPIVPDVIMASWQRSVNLLAQIMNVPATLIMHITEQTMAIFLKSDNPENPYPLKGCDSLCHGLYCETVIGLNKPLLVENALEDVLWKDNPDVKLNMTSYYGLPLTWPDGEFFGTICVLGHNFSDFDDTFKELLSEFKNFMVRDLDLLYQNKELNHLVNTDILTQVNNRNMLNQILSDEFQRSSRSGDPFAVIFLDLDHFKNINDYYGHATGDQVLQIFASTIDKNIRTIDTFGRWGGDEFLLICPNTGQVGATALMHLLKPTVHTALSTIVPGTTFSYGIGEYGPNDLNHDSVVARADKDLYTTKSKRL